MISDIKFIAAAMSTFALFGVGIGLGKIFSSIGEAIGRNPGAKNDLMPIALLGAALTESVALFAFIMGMIIVFS